MWYSEPDTYDVIVEFTCSECGVEDTADGVYGKGDTEVEVSCEACGAINTVELPDGSDYCPCDERCYC